MSNIRAKQLLRNAAKTHNDMQTRISKDEIRQRINEIKYLSTLIKLCDLIISLPFKYLNNDIPESGLYLLLTLETIFVKELIIRKKIEYSNE